MLTLSIFLFFGGLLLLGIYLKERELFKNEQAEADGIIRTEIVR